MPSSKANIIIEQGCDYYNTITLTDDNGDILDISDFTAFASMKKWYTSANTTAVFNTSIDSVKGEVSIGLFSNQTVIVEAGRYVYDVILINNTTNAVSRFVEGVATVTPGVTIV